jgi:hypothetical protein
MRRAAVVLLAVLGLASAGSGAVRAADPTLGGTLGATASVVVVDSAATIPVSVTLSTPPGWVLEETSFAMHPGDRHTVPVVQVGEDGQVIATMTAIEVPAGMDKASLVLALGLPKPAAFPLLPVGLAVLLGAVLVVALLEYRRRSRGGMML